MEKTQKEYIKKICKEIINSEILEMYFEGSLTCSDATIKTLRIQYRPKEEKK